MPKKERTFAAKLAHEIRDVRRETCPVCGEDRTAIVYIASLSVQEHLETQRRRVKVCGCNRKEIYG